MYKVDCERNLYIAKVLEESVPQIIRAVADCEENFDVDDVAVSALTKNNLIGFPVECKTLLGGWQFQYSGAWNTYFTEDIYDKLKFHSLPPEEGKTPIYFINATDAKGDYTKGKWQKVLDAKGGLCFFAPDCVIFYTNPMLVNAFVGYADYFSCRKTEYGHNYSRHWETKALIDLSKGLYIPCQPDIKLFEK